jgi:protein-S-isoprenylcysteine O-methyltransferase Ste14
VHVVDYLFLACWAAFWVYWLAAASTSKARQRADVGRAVGSRVAVLLLAVLLVRTGLFKHAGTITSPVLQGIGFVLFLGGLALAVWARVYLGRNWGTPMSEKVDPELVTTGPYRRIRHPIYAGIILGLIGTAIAVNWGFSLAAIAAGAFFVYSAVVEERIMARNFPDAYPPYKRRTKMLIPFVL